MKCDAVKGIYKQGAKRTGCVGCGFGAHIDMAGIDTLRRLWPKMYDMIMNYKNNGVRYADALFKAIDKANGNDKGL